YLCPYGALLGLFGFMSPTRINRNQATCIDCGKCSTACAHALKVNTKTSIISPECTACLDCVESCPVDDTLKLCSFDKSKRLIWSAKSLGAAVVVLFYGLTYLATVSGHWKSQLPEVEFRSLLRVIDSPHVTHPGVSFK
ncbi:4Fe-4S dicluster domain-containing protein, partial [bacterium]|nr:4Fe-4S dicluster domain-containing protein [bacterium]